MKEWFLNKKDIRAYNLYIVNDSEAFVVND